MQEEAERALRSGDPDVYDRRYGIGSSESASPSVHRRSSSVIWPGGEDFDLTVVWRESAGSITLLGRSN